MNQKIRIETDVLVVGGGTAGCVAALSAARENVRVVIVESESALGGVATRAGIHRYYYGSPGGLQEEIDRETAEMARLLGGRTMGFHPEAKKIVLARLCREAGIQALLDCTVHRVLLEGDEVAGVEAWGEGGGVTIRAAVTIDATANGNVVHMAGGKMRYGREQDGAYHNYSLVPRRLRDGLIGYDNLDAGWVDPYDPKDVTRAFLKGREWIWQAYEEGLHYYAISSSLGYREGALIDGEKLLTIQDYVEDTAMPDVIARSYSHLDNHGFDTGNESEFSQLWISILGLFVKGLWCDIPYGSLLPKKLKRVLVACRALSVDRDVSMGVRMQKDMHKVGEAAGLAAALSVQSRMLPAELPVHELQQRLVERGVLEAGDLGRTGSRNLAFRHGALAGVHMPPQQAGAYVKELIAYFGSDEQWKAVWLLAKRAEPELSIGQLKLVLEESSTARKLCAALVLTLLGRREQETFLLELLQKRDQTRWNDHPKCLPFWVAALILLRMMKSPAAVQEALKLLDEGSSAVESVFVLTYLKESADQLTEADRRTIAQAVTRWASRPELGDDYRMHGGRSESLRWSLELHAAEVLARCGEADREACEAWLSRYEGDARGYAHQAAAALRRRLQEGEAKLPHRADVQLGDFDAAVIGGGIAGVVCAAALSRRGCRVLLAEDSAGLLTEVTRCRMTRWPAGMESGAGEVGAEAELLIACLSRLGALRNGEVEPVLAQLAVDRFLQEAGVTLLLEARCLGFGRRLPDGRQIVTFAMRNCQAKASVQTLVDCTPEAVLFRQETESGIRPADAGQGTSVSVMTATLVNWKAAPEQRQQLQLDSGGGPVSVRIRPSLYEGEVYLDVSAGIGGEEDPGLLAAVLTRLRQEGVMPEEAALAYIADRPWCLPAFAVEATTRGAATISFGDGTMVGAGLWTSAVYDRLQRAEMWERDVLAARQQLEAGEEAARVVLSAAQGNA
ncbi:FAD dependent oxidoreductase [Paenibacillus sp. UNCCL117]|uniref:FAD-dependent oxidoreductase n=1 Tax=unclassified Paenibacillus TaxID=185978 RepID=UPI00087ED022|nr:MULTISPECIES: FAD-dependent oxidoreductase [unclassified Paenibacillus]SDD63747.1 FAD dependent oxidoreductase [Paenibacillus sp. cl123]SFW58463.1 FAD dependent oxidoreductase [Paenibacillus sp. UNCCL117]